MHPDQPVFTTPRPAARTQAPVDPWLPPLDHCYRFLADDGRAFIQIPAASPTGLRFLPIRSDAFRDWYFAQTNGTLNKIPTARTFSAICQRLEADAARDSHDGRATIARRVGSRHDGAVLIDLSNPEGEFVEITPEGHRVESGSTGIPFETSGGADDRLSSSAHSAPPSLSPSDPLETLRDTLHLSGPDWLRCLTWILTALHPTGPYPILVLHGPSGSGKSLAALVLRALVDPSACPFSPMPRSASQLLHLARQNWILAFDHVSHITPSLSDAICRITSGAGLSWREPGRRDPVQHWLKRPVLLTVTDTCELPPDLAARALFVTLPDLTPETRRTEAELRDTLDPLVPQIFHALCDAISRALANQRPIPSLTRHATALSWMTAAFPDLAADLSAAIAEPPPPPAFLSQLRALLAETPHWEGHAADLLPKVRAAETPKGISQALNKHALAIADAGIRITFRRRHEGRRILTIDASPEIPPSAEPQQFQPCTPHRLLTPNSSLLAPPAPPPPAPPLPIPEIPQST